MLRAFGLPFVQVAVRAAAFLSSVKFWLLHRYLLLDDPQFRRTFFFVASSTPDMYPARIHIADDHDSCHARWKCCPNLCARAARRDEPPAVQTQLRQRAGDRFSTSNGATAARGRIYDATALSKVGTTARQTCV